MSGSNIQHLVCLTLFIVCSLTFVHIGTHLVTLRHNLHDFEQPNNVAAAADDTINVRLQTTPFSHSVAIVNEQNHHFDVLAGCMHVLSSWKADLHVYVRRPRQLVKIKKFCSIFPLGQCPGKIHKLPAEFSEINMPLFEFVVFISPEYNSRRHLRSFLQRVRPRAALALIHDGGGASRWVYDLADEFPEILSFAALAPHVASYANEELRGSGIAVGWLLPVVPYQGACKDGHRAEGCNRDICVQGFSDLTSGNYERLWELLDASSLRDGVSGCGGGMSGAAVNCAEAAPLHVRVLGKNGRGDMVEVPSHLDHLVKQYSGLDYKAYYQTMNECSLLLPLSSSANHTTSKMFSTVLTSLITGTPIAATQEILGSYYFLSDTSTFVDNGSSTKSEMDLITELALGKLTDTEQLIARTRREILDLREYMNIQAAAFMQSLLEPAN